MADFGASSHVRPLDTERILRTLDAHGVEYVLIGGIACLMHGASRVTVDADVLAATERDNLVRLYDALGELEASVLVSDRRLAMEDGDPWEVEALRRGPEALGDAPAWHFTTDAGPLDLVFDAAGVGGYHEHLPGAEVRVVFGTSVKVAGLDDLICSKEALRRDKDTSVLSELRALRDRKDHGSAPVAGYSGTPLARKLGIAPGMTVALLGAPGGLLDLPDGVTRRRRAGGSADVVVAFFTGRAAVRSRLATLGRMVFPTGGLWIAWPKRASGMATDLTEDVIREVALPTGLVDNKVCAIDETWSALRLVWRVQHRRPR